MAMNRLRYALTAIAIVAIGSLAIWAVYLGMAAFLKASSTAQLGVATAIISVIALIYNNSRQQAREIRARQFAEKRAAYQKFFDFMFEMFNAQRQGEELTPEQTVERMNAIVKDVMVWGSAETINQYNRFLRQSLVVNADRPLALFENVESLMRSFRKDLGHDDRPLEKLALTKLIVKPDEHDKLDG